MAATTQAAETTAAEPDAAEKTAADDVAETLRRAIEAIEGAAARAYDRVQEEASRPRAE
jgi:hypothetical protein